MANTKSSAKRARQAESRQARNQIVRSSTRTSVRHAIESIQKKDTTTAADTFKKAIKALSKAASKGVIPKGRASRKISRLTHLANKSMPQIVSAPTVSKK